MVRILEVEFACRKQVIFHLLSNAAFMLLCNHYHSVLGRWKWPKAITKTFEKNNTTLIVSLCSVSLLPTFIKKTLILYQYFLFTYQEYSLNFYLRQSWTDKRLAYADISPEMDPEMKWGRRRHWWNMEAWCVLPQRERSKFPWYHNSKSPFACKLFRQGMVCDEVSCRWWLHSWSLFAVDETWQLNN